MHRCGRRSSDGTGYQPSIVTGAANGQTIGSVSLHPPAAGQPAIVQFTGSISSQNGASQEPLLMQLSVLEQ